MNTLLPLQIRTPDFSYPKVANAVQDFRMGEARLKNQQMDNELEALRLGDATDLSNAEKDFRKRTAAGDPNADEALAGHPALQKKIWDAFDGMTPQAYKAAKKKAVRFGDAARNVLMFKDGSPEQAEAWNTEINKLADEGIIDREKADNLIKSGPNPLIIEQALSVEQFAKLHDSSAVRADRKQKYYEDKEDRIATDADERIGIQNERLEIARDKAKLDADRIRSVIEKNKAATEKASGGKGDRQDAVPRDEIKKVLDAQRKSLRLDDPDFRTDEPEAYNAAVDRYETYRTEVFKQFGYGADGRPVKPRALGVDKVADTAPPAKKAAADNYPIGATATGPNGQKLKKTERGWEPI